MSGRAAGPKFYYVVVDSLLESLFLLHTPRTCLLHRAHRPTWSTRKHGGIVLLRYSGIGRVSRPRVPPLPPLPIVSVTARGHLRGCISCRLSRPLSAAGLDAALIHSTIDTIPSPNGLLGRMGGARGIVRENGGIVVVVSAYEWNEEVTPVGAWLGGYLDDAGNRVGCCCCCCCCCWKDVRVSACAPPRASPRAPRYKSESVVCPSKKWTFVARRRRNSVVVWCVVYIFGFGEGKNPTAWLFVRGAHGWYLGHHHDRLGLLVELSGRLSCIAPESGDAEVRTRCLALLYRVILHHRQLRFTDFGASKDLSRARHIPRDPPPSSIKTPRSRMFTCAHCAIDARRVGVQCSAGSSELCWNKRVTFFFWSSEHACTTPLRHFQRTQPGSIIKPLTNNCITVFSCTYYSPQTCRVVHM